MADELVVFDSKKFKASKDGLRIVAALTPDDWKEAWEAVQKVDNKVSYTTKFFLADLAAYASSPVAGWGNSKYDELCEWSGLDNSTMRRLAWISNRFSIGFRENVWLRNPTFVVTFTHFMAVAPIKDNDLAFQLLLRAIEGHWSSDRLREEVQKYLHPELPDEYSEPKPIRFKFSFDEFEYLKSKLLGDNDPRAVSILNRIVAVLEPETE